MKKNKTWAIVALLVLALLVSACGGKATEVPPQTTGQPATPDVVLPDGIPTAPANFKYTTAEGETASVWVISGDGITEDEYKELLQNGGIVFFFVQHPEAFLLVVVGTTLYYGQLAAMENAPVIEIPAAIAAPAAPGAPQFTPAELEAIVAAQAATFSAPNGATLVSGLALTEDGCQSRNTFNLPLSNGLNIFEGGAKGDCTPETVNGGIEEVIKKIEEKLPQLSEADKAIAIKAVDFLRAIIRGVTKKATTSGGIFP